MDLGVGVGHREVVQEFYTKTKKVKKQVTLVACLELVIFGLKEMEIASHSLPSNTDYIELT